MIEASSYDIFGITIDREDFDSIRLAFANTYNQLSKENEKWQDVGFRKTQIASLWESALSFIDRAVSTPIYVETIREIDKKFVRENLVLNTENEIFLKHLARNCRESRWLFKLRDMSLEEESVRLSFQDPRTKQKSHVKVDLDRIWKSIRIHAAKTENLLKQFVESIQSGQRILFTSSLVAGLAAITLISVLWLGALAFPLVKVIVPLAIAIVCLFAETVSTCESAAEAIRALARRGIEFL